ncbi:MAG: TonB-dependent receptor [Sphingomonadaceae bacterium]|nr:TonB-dependent receptor [Sphingomonadaceae bacterium]
MKLSPFHATVARSALCLALMAFVAPVAALAQDAPAEEADANKEDIVVTASGRSIGASKVPYNVTAQSEAELREENITDIKRLIADSPSINAPGNGARFADSVTVRGLNVSPVNANNLEQFARSTLAYYLDDTPLPNIAYRIKDVARVETLLGPQGTLYGAGSLGGTVRYITNKPDFDAVSGRVSTSLFIAEGGALSHDTDAVINLPIADTLAFRASIARLDDNGYTDRVSNPSWRTGAFAWTTKPDAGKNLYKNDDYNRVTSGRASLAWKLSDDIIVTLSHAQQKQLAHGTTATSLLPLGIANATTPAQVTAYIRDPGSLPCTLNVNCQFNNSLEAPFLAGRDVVASRYPEFARRKFRLSSFDFDADLGFADLHSSTSYFKDSRRGQADYAGQGWLFYYVFNGNFGPTDFPTQNSAFITFDNTYKGWNHETRLTSNNDGPFNWIAGVYYTDTERSLKFSEYVPTMDVFFGVNRAVSGGNVDEGYRENLGSKYREIAVYGELGYELTPRWKVNVGGRVFNYKDRAIAQIRDYSFDLVNNNVDVSKSVKGKAYFKFNTSYDITDDALIYATVSQGFRRGGTNGFRNVGTRTVDPAVQNYKPDSTINYEAGLKGFFADRRLYLQANVYQIDWKDVQTYYSQDISGFPVNGTANGPDARSRGFEGMVRFNLSDALQVNFATAYTDAKWSSTRTVCLYTNGTSCRTWTKGQELGGAPKWKNSASIRYSGELGSNANGWVSLSGRFVGSVQVDRADFPTDDIPSYPSYAVFDLRGGVDFGSFNVGLWVENFTDKRAQISQQNDRVMGARILYTSPRTFGMNLTYGF